VWLYRFLPLLDWPDWLFQGGLFTRVLRGEALPGYAFSALPVPNATSTLAIGLLGLAVDLETAGKLFLSAYVLLWLLGARFLLAATHAELGRELALIPPLFVLNFAFFHGNVNFAVGTALLFVALGLLLAHRRDLAHLPVAPLALVAVAIALSHGASYFTLLLSAGLLAIFDLRPRSLARVALTLAPSALLLVPYALLRVGSGGAAVATDVPLSYLLKGKVASIPGYFAPFQGFYPFLDLGGAAVFLAARAGRERPVLTVLAVFAAIYLLSPVAIGDFGSPGERLLYPGLMLALALGLPGLPPRLDHGLARALRASAVGLLALQFVFLHTHGAHVAAELARVEAEVERLEVPGAYRIVREDTFDVSVPPRVKPFYLPVHEALFRVPYYRAAARGEHIAIFETGLFRDLRREPSATTSAAVLAQTGPGDAVLVLGGEPGTGLIARSLAPPLRILLADRYVAALAR
jgi:hypothetical protein